MMHSASPATGRYLGPVVGIRPCITPRIPLMTEEMRGCKTTPRGEMVSVTDSRRQVHHCARRED
jgi:hypothetical protein